MQQFTFILKDNTQKAFHSFYWFLYFLHVIAIAAILFKATDVYHKNVAWIFLVLLSLLRFSYPYVKDKISLTIYNRIVSLIMIVFWIVLFAWVPAIVLIIAIIFANFVLIKKSNAVFSNENIIITKSLFKKVYRWAEVDNAVLKDHLLSIDFKNNHLIQVEVTPESFSIDEATFNQFCLHQLEIINHTS